MRLSRVFWRGLTPVTVLVCSVLAANALANVISQHAFPEEVFSEVVETGAVMPREPAVERSKDPDALLAHNMFCSSCTPENERTFPDEVATHRQTELPLRLIATNISKRGSHSFASVLNTSSMRQGAYEVGQSIPGAGVVRAIGHDYLDFTPSSGGALERILFDSGPRSQELPVARTASAKTSSTLAEEYVRVLSDTHYEVDRDLIGKLQGNPLLAGARARPVQQSGTMRGVRLFAVRAQGLAFSMGLRNGDTVLAANGVALNSAEAGLELLGQLKTRDHWSIEIERNGKPVRLEVDLH